MIATWGTRPGSVAAACGRLWNSRETSDPSTGLLLLGFGASTRKLWRGGFGSQFPYIFFIKYNVQNDFWWMIQFFSFM
uniref:Uncharacterized protein n=1 Tax=Kalanchoe fedtschenkoi TaxID=63787 RepID=A0A7N0SVD9_KALFE